MDNIKLNYHQWRIDLKKPLGSPGGFGEVFLGEGIDGKVAIKRLKVTVAQAAHRELAIGQALYGRQLSHVVPVLDWGQDADSDRYFLVMPVCESSLQDALRDKGSFLPREVMGIMMQILEGLGEVNDITHRDMKPSNILWHESVWKVADFGIAKFVEDSTSLESLRSCLTPPYAAPEQWLLQRPTPATDIYAVGCIAHALLTGQPPFKGDVDALRDQHLTKDPALLEALPPGAKAIVAMMLRKSPEIRPKRDRCIEVLKQCMASESRPTSKAVVQLAEAVSQVAVAQAKAEAERKVAQERQRQRDALFEQGVRELRGIKERLFSRILEHAGDVMFKEKGQGGSGRLVLGTMEFNFDTDGHFSSSNGMRRCDDMSSWGVHRKRSKWDIVAFGEMSIVQHSSSPYVRSANLVFCRPHDGAEYRWFEMAFWSLADQPRLKAYPSCLRYVFEIDEALSNTVGLMNLAHKPVAIDGENEEPFIEYWIGVVALGAMGKLSRPTQMPMPR